MSIRSYVEEDRVFFIALAVSLVIHLAFLINLSFSNKHHLKSPLKSIEVTYQQLSSPRSSAARTPNIEERKLSKDLRMDLKKQGLPDQIVKSKTGFLNQFKFKVSRPSQAVKIDAKKVVNVPVLKPDKKLDSKYFSYTKSIRKRISDKAYSYIDHPDFEAGEVYLTFALFKDGALKDVRVIHEKTRANDYLKNAALQSIKESSPFPVFPGGLNYPELSFNVVISFELTE